MASAGSDLPSVANSSFLRITRESALSKPLQWRDDEQIGVAALRPGDTRETTEADLRPVEEGGRETKKMNMYQAIRDAMSIVLQKDPTSVVFGEDVFFGGVFRCTTGLSEEFGPSQPQALKSRSKQNGQERVFNTPLTEQGIVGFGIGMATMGQTSVAECQFADYIFPAFDQIVSEAAKYRYRSGGEFNAGSLTIRTPCSAVGHGALYHSQSIEGFFMQASGIKVVMPRSPLQAKGLLLASIRDPNPVIFLEPKVLYRSAIEQVPTGDFQLPLSSAEVLREGSDLTIVSWGPPLYTIETALHMLRSPPPELAPLIPSDLRNLSVDLIDLRTIQPYDIDTVVKSVKKTGRCIVVHEAARTGGVGGELAAEISQRCFLRLEVPVTRVTGWDTPFPLAHERWYLPDTIRILDSIIETMQY